MKKKIELSILVAISLIISIYLYIYPNPGILGGSSSDALPVLSDYLTIFILVLLVLLIITVPFILYREETIFKRVLFSVISVISFGILYQLLILFFDPSYLNSYQAQALYMHQNPHDFLSISKEDCDFNIENFLFNNNSLHSVPANEVEYKCGEKIYFLDITSQKIYKDYSLCKNSTYNNFMRKIGSKKRKECLSDELMFRM